MDSGLRSRHLRLWIVLGPMLLIGAVVLLALRPPASGSGARATAVRVSERGSP